MPWRRQRTLRPLMLMVVHREELHVGDRAAVDLVEDLLGVRALDLEAVVPARDGLAARMRRASGRRG
jgi:hypothetical protein